MSKIWLPSLFGELFPGPLLLLKWHLRKDKREHFFEILITLGLFTAWEDDNTFK